ncbi:MAG: hypothetical protein R2705_19880 [Ilumatobacteraceae bacterium]
MTRQCGTGRRRVRGGRRVTCSATSSRSAIEDGQDRAGLVQALDPFDRPGRHGGDDPAGTWAQVRDEVLALLDRPGVLQRAIRTSSGEDTVDAALGFNIADTTIHAWDLARALGVDDRLDPGLVARVVEVTEPRIEMLAAAGHFAPGRAPDDDASPQERLLALVGRADMGR